MMTDKNKQPCLGIVDNGKPDLYMLILVGWLDPISPLFQDILQTNLVSSASSNV